MHELSAAHLDDFVLLRLAAGDLDAKEREAARAHLEACAVCRAVSREIEELDAELRLLTRETVASPKDSLRELPERDPFRSRPRGYEESPARSVSPEVALWASEEGEGIGQGILEAAREGRLKEVLSDLSLTDPANRFGLLYALQESGKQIADSPVRSQILGEQVLKRLRREPPGTSWDEAERLVPHMVLLGQAQLLAGQACNWTGDFEKAQTHFQIAYQSFARGSRDEVPLALVELYESQRRSFAGRAGEGLLLARRALDTFETREMEDYAARARVAEGIALSTLERDEEALAAFRSALPVFEARGLWSNHVGAVNSIATCLVNQGRVNEARREYARALRRASRENQRPRIAAIRFGLARVLYLACSYREAALSFARATGLFAECGLLSSALTASLHEIESWAWSGDISRARHRLEIFKGQVARYGALDPSVSKHIEEALSGIHPDFQRIASLREQAEEALRERLGAA